MMHIVIADHPKQQANVERLLTTISKKSFVDLQSLAALESSDEANGFPADSNKSTTCIVKGGGGFDLYTKKRVWAVATFGDVKSDRLVRRAAVEVFCARTYDCCPLFKIILLVNSAQYAALPAIVKLLTGRQKGYNWVCNLHDSDNDDPSLEPDDYGIVPDTKMHVEESTLEEQISYELVENGSGDIADLQEAVFNNDPSIVIVTYNERFGEGAPFVRILRDALKFNIVVHTLDLTGSFAGDVSCIALTSILHTSRKLKTISLRETSLTDVGMTHLAAALRKSECVTSLNVSRNPSITDVGLVALASIFSTGSASNIVDLDISSNNAMYDQTRMWTDDAIEFFFDSLAQHRKIESLSVAGCALQPNHFTHMALKWLQQGGGEKLSTLRCQHNIVEDEPLALVLQYAPNLKVLDLEHTGLSSVGFRVLGRYVCRKDTKLEWLKVDTNNAMMQRPLPAELHANLIEETVVAMRDQDGHAATTFVNSLFGNYVLNTLSACRVNIGDEAVVALCDLMASRQCGVQHLDLASNCNIEETCAHKIKELLVGGYLSEEEEAERDAAWAQGIEAAPVLSLSLCGNSPAIGERAVLAMYSNRGLQNFDISNMGIVDAMLMPLNEGIRENPFLRLRVIKVGRNTLYADGVRHLAEHVKGSKFLVELGLDDTWHCFTDILGQECSLSRTAERGAVFLRSLLEALAIQPSPTLKRLDLSYNDVTDPVALLLMSAIASNCNLEQLVLHRNPISAEVASKLVEDCRIDLKERQVASPRRAMRLQIQQ